MNGDPDVSYCAARCICRRAGEGGGAHGGGHLRGRRACHHRQGRLPVHARPRHEAQAVAARPKIAIRSRCTPARDARTTGASSTGARRRAHLLYSGFFFYSGFRRASDAEKRSAAPESDPCRRIRCETDPSIRCKPSGSPLQKRPGSAAPPQAQWARVLRRASQGVPVGAGNAPPSRIGGPANETIRRPTAMMQCDVPRGRPQAASR